jgi:hypothetical protein
MNALVLVVDDVANREQGVEQIGTASLERPDGFILLIACLAPELGVGGSEASHGSRELAIESGLLTGKPDYLGCQVHVPGRGQIVDGRDKPVE